jgi:Bacterial tandem repeat domain 1
MRISNFIAVCLWTLILSQLIFAQSGRVIPTSSPAPTPKAEDSVFTEIKKESPPCDANAAQIVYLPHQKINDFVKELNRLGQCGYYLDKIAKMPLGTESTVLGLFVFGVVKLDVPNKYEYNWFAGRTPGEVQTIANMQAEKGFYFRDKMMFISGRCSESTQKRKKENEDLGALGDLANLGLGTSGSVFIFERKNGVIKKNEYRVIDGATESGNKALAQNQQKLDELVTKGFRPVDVFYLGVFDLFSVIMEKDENIKPEGEYRLLRNSYGINKKFSELSSEGFKPIAVGFYFAVLQRKTNDSLNLTFDSAENYNEVVKKLVKWNEQGAKYQTTGVADYDVGCDPFEGKLFFAVTTKKQTAGFAKSEYKILEMSDFNERSFKKKDKNASMTDPPTANILQEFQKLLKEGFDVKDLFWLYNEPFILFERANP